MKPSVVGRRSHGSSSPGAPLGRCGPGGRERPGRRPRLGPRRAFRASWRAETIRCRRRLRIVSMGQSRRCGKTVREMPPGSARLPRLRVPGALAFLGLTMPIVIDRGGGGADPFIGVVWMALLAYLIFTMTLVLQKQAGGLHLSMGLISLLLPLGIVIAVLTAGRHVLAPSSRWLRFAFLFFSLRRPQQSRVVRANPRPSCARRGRIGAAAELDHGVPEAPAIGRSQARVRGCGRRDAARRSR